MALDCLKDGAAVVAAAVVEAGARALDLAVAVAERRPSASEWVVVVAAVPAAAAPPASSSQLEHADPAPRYLAAGGGCGGGSF